MDHDVLGHVCEPKGVDLINKHTDRDQWSWVFLNYPKKYFATDRMPKKYFLKSKTLKIPSKNTIHLAKVKHDMIIMENRDY